MKELNPELIAWSEIWGSSHRYAKRLFGSSNSGTGLLLLLTFLASTVLVASSMSLVLVPSVARVVGSTSIDTTTANQVALYGLDAAQSDILSKLGNGTTVDTSYRYPASSTNTVSIPTYPGSGANTSVGSYYVTVTKARGYTYIIQAIATAGGATVAQNRLVQLKATPSIYSSAYAIYSLRKVLSTYTGYAVRVRCASTSTTQDIGFTGSGDFDLTAFRTCLGDSTLPLDVTTGAKLAFGLRKLSSSYSGYAIKVRRDSDNTTQNIGFDSNGNLDVASLLSFVGTGGGYIDTWYDQSGSGKNLTQATQNYQPRIVYQGILDTVNNAPTIWFNNNNYYLYNTALGGTLITGSNVTAFTVAQQNSSATSGDYDRFVALHKSNASNKEEWQVIGGLQVLATDDTAAEVLSEATTSVNGVVSTSTAAGSATISVNEPFQATTYVDGSNMKLYLNGTQADTHAITASFAPDQIYVGVGGYNSGITTDYLDGTVSEVIIFNSALSAANRQSIERSQGHYFNIVGLADGFITTWYDQSGNGRNLTQATTSAQPTIAPTSSRPAAYFDGTTDYIENTAQNTTTSQITGFTAAQTSNTGTVPGNGRIVSLGKTGDGNDWGQVSSTALILRLGNALGNARNNDLTISTNFKQVTDFQSTVIFDGTNRTVREKQSGNNYSNTTTTSGSGNLVINNIRAGYSFNSGGGHEMWKGKIYEILLFPTGLSPTNYQTVESAEQTYYGI